MPILQVQQRFDICVFLQQSRIMSFISFDQKKLARILAICSQISNPKNQVELFTYTLFEIEPESTVKIMAMNESVSFNQSIKSINLEELEVGKKFLVKTDLMSNAVNLIQDDIVGLEIDFKAKTLIVQGSKAKHTLRINTDQANEFKIINIDSDKDEAHATLKVHEFKSILKSAMVAAGNPRTVYQPEFMHICFTVNFTDKKIVVASTDRYRVARLQPEAKVEIIKELDMDKKNYLILPKNLSLLEHFEDKNDIVLNFNASFLEAVSNNANFVIRYGEGQFPDYDKIIPQSFVCSFSVARGDIYDALKQVLFSAKINNDSHSVKLKVDPQEKKITMVAETKDGYASESVIDTIDYDGQEDKWEQAFNIDYLTSYISTIETSHLVWEANPGKPSVLSPQNKKTKELYLVSGLR